MPKFITLHNRKAERVLVDINRIYAITVKFCRGVDVSAIHIENVAEPIMVTETVEEIMSKIQEATNG